MKIISALLLFMVCFTNSEAQQFRYEAKVDAVDATAFYKIWLSPQINSESQPGFGDLRLLDNDGKETPYLISIEAATSANTNFINYPITNQKSFTDSITLITFRNSEKSKIDNISMLIKNADVQKQIKLTGSDDLKNWFVVKEYTAINSINNSIDVAQLKLINFPLSNYEYYQIEIDDSNSKPINILNIGYYHNSFTAGSYAVLQPDAVKYADSLISKTTWVRITFNRPVAIDAMNATITAPQYFLRNADLYQVSKDKAGKEIHTFLNTIELKSGTENKFTFAAIRAQELLLCIHNDDNPSLQFSAIQFYQLNRYALAYIEKSKSYALRFGNDSLAPPAYDLKFFRNNIPDTLSIIKTQPITNLQQLNSPSIEKPYTFFTDKKFIWVAIAFIILLLGTVTFKMLKEK